MKRCVVFFLVALLCYLAGDKVKELMQYEGAFYLTILAFVVLLGGGFYVIKWAARRHRSHGVPYNGEEPQEGLDTAQAVVDNPDEGE